jgi:hypothetical protein
LRKIVHELEILIDQLEQGHDNFAYYTDRHSLPIAPEKFCWVNDFDKQQSAIITLVSLYSMKADGIADLKQAKDLAEQMLNEKLSGCRHESN